MKLRSLKLIGIACGMLAIVSCEKPGTPGAKNVDFEKAIDKGATLVKVGDFEIKEGYLELIGRINPQLKAQIAAPAGRKKILDTITEQELLYQASLKKGLEDDPIVREKMGLYARVIISQALVENELQKKVTEYYEAHKKDEFEQVQISDIFKETTPPKKAADSKEPAPSAEELKKQAQATLADVAKKLKEGGDFAKLAEEYSDDPISKKKGGDLGLVSRTNKRIQRKGWEALVTKAFEMKVGEVSDIIETKDGLHIIKVTAEPKVSPLEEVEAKIRMQVGTTGKKDIVEELKKTIKVENLVKEDPKAAGDEPVGEDHPPMPPHPGQGNPHNGPHPGGMMMPPPPPPHGSGPAEEVKPEPAPAAAPKESNG